MLRHSLLAVHQAHDDSVAGRAAHPKRAAADIAFAETEIILRQTHASRVGDDMDALLTVERLVGVNRDRRPADDQPVPDGRRIRRQFR